MTPIIIYPKPQYSTTMIFAVLDVSLIMGLNIGEIDVKFFTITMAVFVEKLLSNLALLSHLAAKI